MYENAHVIHLDGTMFVYRGTLCWPGSVIGSVHLHMESSYRTKKIDRKIASVIGPLEGGKEDKIRVIVRMGVRVRMRTRMQIIMRVRVSESRNESKSKSKIKRGGGRGKE